MGGSFDGGAQHLAASGGVHVEHGDPQLSGGFDGGGNGVRDVVIFKVQKHFTAGRNQLAHELRSFGGEKLFSYLISGYGVAKGLDDLASLGGARDIERHDQPIAG